MKSPRKRRFRSRSPAFSWNSGSPRLHSQEFEFSKFQERNSNSRNRIFDCLRPSRSRSPRDDRSFNNSRSSVDYRGQKRRRFDDSSDLFGPNEKRFVYFNQENEESFDGDYNRNYGSVSIID